MLSLYGGVEGVSPSPVKGSTTDLKVWEHRYPTACRLLSAIFTSSIFYPFLFGILVYVIETQNIGYLYESCDFLVFFTPFFKLFFFFFKLGVLQQVLWCLSSAAVVQGDS